MGGSELLSVPYALYAANGGGADDDADPTSELQDWSTLPGIPADIADGDQVDDADADPANEMQTLTQTGPDVTLSNGGGTISVNDADADATNEIELPTDAESGNLAYYDGQSWKRIPNGGAGQVLTLGDDGIPFWGGLIGITLPNGDEVFFSPDDNFIPGTGLDGLVWGSNTDVPNLPNLDTRPEASMDYNGEANTVAIIAALGNYDPPSTNYTSYAAKLCDDLVAYGYDDWYLPSAGELLFAATQTNLSFNSNTFYWSSSERSSTRAWGYLNSFINQSNIYGDPKSGPFSGDPTSCRCVRRN